MKNADAQDALAPASVAVANPNDAPTTNAAIEEAVAELARLVTNIERRLARPPIPEAATPLTPLIRRSPSMPKRFD